MRLSVPERETVSAVRLRQRDGFYLDHGAAFARLGRRTLS
jgi:hypothetical protein